MVVLVVVGLEVAVVEEGEVVVAVEEGEEVAVVEMVVVVVVEVIKYFDCQQGAQFYSSL